MFLFGCQVIIVLEMTVGDFLSEQVFVALKDAIIVLYKTSFFWLPLILAAISIIIWVKYVRFAFLFKQKKVLLEIKVPQDITKSPAAMEIFLSALYQKGSAT